MSNFKNNIAIVFPGQGSQSVGMMSSLYEAFDVVQKTYDQASEILGFDLWEMTKEGPAESLNQTINTQPAMLVSGVAAWRALTSEYDFIPKFFLGHSLGEYTALVASEQLDFEEAVRLAKKRASVMQSAMPEGLGAMAAVIGLDEATINSVCQLVSSDDQQVWPANNNAPGQVVIAGHRVAIEKACEQLKEAGAKRALILPVSVPSHCPLMQPAAEAMKSAFLQVNWQPAKAPIIHNSDVAVHTNSADLISVLSDQLIKPVRWVESIQYLSTQSINTVIEVGPGKVLSGLNKRIDKSMVSQSIFDVNSLVSVKKELLDK